MFRMLSTDNEELVKELDKDIKKNFPFNRWKNTLF